VGILPALKIFHAGGMRASRAILDDGLWIMDYLFESEHSTFNIQHPPFKIARGAHHLRFLCFLL